MRRPELDRLDPRCTYWVPAVVAPVRDWSAAPGCRRGARYLLDPDDCRPTRENVALFSERGECLEWMMARRVQIRAALPGAEVRPVSLARWMLGMD